MTKPQAALLETRLRSIRGAFGISLRIATIAETRVSEKLFGDPFGVILPVGGDVNLRPRFQRPMQQVTETLVDDAPLVVALLVPGIGEEQ